MDKHIRDTETYQDKSEEKKEFSIIIGKIIATILFIGFISLFFIAFYGINRTSKCESELKEELPRTSMSMEEQMKILDEVNSFGPPYECTVLNWIKPGMNYSEYQKKLHEYEYKRRFEG